MKNQIKSWNQLKDSRLLYEKNLPVFGYMLIICMVLLLSIVVIWSIRTPKVDMVTSSGITESENKNYIMSPYTGEIVNLYIEEGMLVEEGDVLFSLKSTDLNLQKIQLSEQKKVYQARLDQYQKLIQSIKDDFNYFDLSNIEDNLYYSQFEVYKSQIAQNTVDINAYKSYGYTEEQIEAELQKAQVKNTEIYYSTLQAAENAILEATSQLTSIEAQLLALESGMEEYTVTANATGIIHMLSAYGEGMIVQAASAIATIASEQEEYHIVAYVSPGDMPKIHLDDRVDVAIAGLNQSIYGTIAGTVMKIDSDITISQNAEGNQNSSYFKVYIKPHSTYLISKEGNKINLSNGMAVETRIQYDEETYFDYVMEGLGVFTR